MPSRFRCSIQEVCDLVNTNSDGARVATSSSVTINPNERFDGGDFAQALSTFFDLAYVEGAARKKTRSERTGTMVWTALEFVQTL